MSPNTSSLDTATSYITLGLDLLGAAPTPNDSASIIEELERLQTIEAHCIKRLSTHRAEWSRVLNRQRSPIYRLPPEIIGYILVYLREGSNSLSYYTLQRVSSLFYHVLHSTPHFWTKFQLHYPRPMTPGFSVLARKLLDLHYHNVKTLLLDAEIDHVWCFCTEVVELLCTEHSKKIRSLSVHATADLGPCTFTFGDSITFPYLQSLRLTQSRLQSLNNEGLFNAPNLRSLALYTSSVAFIFPWNLLHSLTLWDHDAQGCLEAISQCTNLRSLSLHPRNTRSQSASTTTVTLPQLKILNYFTFSPVRLWENILAYQLALPALEQLTWDSKFEQGESRQKFFGDLQSLRILNIHFPSQHLLDPEELFSCVSPVTSLRLLITSESRSECVALLSALILTPETNILPDLQELRIEWDKSLHPTAKETILKVVRSRRNCWDLLVGCQLEIITLKCSGYEFWSPEFKEGWKRLQGEGLQATICEKNKSPSGWMCGQDSSATSVSSDSA